MEDTMIEYGVYIENNKNEPHVYLCARNYEEAYDKFLKIVKDLKKNNEDIVVKLIERCSTDTVLFNSEFFKEEEPCKEEN